VKATDSKQMNLQIAKIWYPTQVRHWTLQATVPQTPDKSQSRHIQISHQKNCADFEAWITTLQL
jgi:hypothetical protein